MRHLHELPEQVCDSIRFQPHTFNASAFEHTGTCSCLARKFRAWAECGGGGGGFGAQSKRTAAVRFHLRDRC